MMNKIVVTVVVPMIEEKYDIYIPVSKNIKITIDLIAKTVNELSEGHFLLKSRYTLMNSEGVVFNEESNVKESGIKNGDRIILI